MRSTTFIFCALFLCLFVTFSVAQKSDDPKLANSCPSQHKAASPAFFWASIDAQYEYDADNDETVFTYNIVDFDADAGLTYDRSLVERLTLSLDPGPPAIDANCYEPVIMDVQSLAAGLGANGHLSTSFEQNSNGIDWFASENQLTVDALLNQSNGPVLEGATKAITWNDIGKGNVITLPTDGLLHTPVNDPVVDCNDGSTPFTKTELVSGIHFDGSAITQDELSALRGVTQFSSEDVASIVGKQMVAIVYDADLTPSDSGCQNTDIPFGDLRGIRRGLFFFKVIQLVPAADENSLPHITVRVLETPYTYELCGRFLECDDNYVLEPMDGAVIQDSEPQLASYAVSYFGDNQVLRFPVGQTTNLVLKVRGDREPSVQHVSLMARTSSGGSVCSFVTTAIVPTCYVEICPPDRALARTSAQKLPTKRAKRLTIFANVSLVQPMIAPNLVPPRQMTQQTFVTKSVCLATRSTKIPSVMKNCQSAISTTHTTKIQKVVTCCQTGVAHVSSAHQKSVDKTKPVKASQNVLHVSLALA
mmetsp:Transcript_14826/g.22209  ORF Transcript_14826/g.22209 Transcript_14826/m.22209 type:complete len:533 (-) Transcript_14826:1729-3327(-)